MQDTARPPAAPTANTANGANANSQKKPLYIANRYALHQMIGEGAYGIVVSATDVVTKQDVAIKRVRKVLNSYPMAVRTLRELKFLRLLRGHENIIEVKDILMPSECDKFNDTFVVFELMPCDLNRVIQASSLKPANIKFLMFQLLRGIRYMHAAGVLHRDLKPNNVLVDAKCRLKICDFGLARAVFRVPESYHDVMLWTDYVATRWYRAPELIIPHETNYSTAIDMWSAGCIFAELITRRPLFPGRDTNDQLSRIINLTGKPNPSTIRKLRSQTAQDFIASLPPLKPKDLRVIMPDAEPAVLRLIGGMLEFDPDERLTAEQALKDPYFSDWLLPLGYGPPPKYLDESEFEFERRLNMKDQSGMEEIRKDLIREILFYHPEEAAQLQSNFVVQSESDRFAAQMQAQQKGMAPLRNKSLPQNRIQRMIKGEHVRHVKPMARHGTDPSVEIAAYNNKPPVSPTDDDQEMQE